MRQGRWLASMAVVMMAAAPAAALAQMQTRTAANVSLEGTRWMVKVTPDAKTAAAGEKAFDDTIVFENSKVTMTECAKYGFGASDYKLSKTKDGMSFITRQESAAEGKSEWTGEAQADSIRGTLKWTRNDGTVLNYTFEGKKSNG